VEHIETTADEDICSHKFLLIDGFGFTAEIAETAEKR
jgi:hypothetical protein